VGAVGVEATAAGLSPRSPARQGQTEAIALVFVALPLVLGGLLVARTGLMPGVVAVVGASAARTRRS
jgi:hypothetical protein